MTTEAAAPEPQKMNILNNIFHAIETKLSPAKDILALEEFVSGKTVSLPVSLSEGPIDAQLMPGVDVEISISGSLTISVTKK